MSRPLRWALAALVLVAAAALAYQAGVWLRPAPPLAGTELEEPAPVGDVKLTAAGGERVRLSEVAGEWTLVFFGFVDCPDVCPMTMARLGETYVDLGEPEALRVLMVTVDPERDDPARLERYVDGFHPDFRGLGGSSQDVAEAARRFFVGYNQAGGEVVHTEAVALLDERARIRAVYTQDALGGLEGDLKRRFGSG